MSRLKLKIRHRKKRGSDFINDVLELLKYWKLTLFYIPGYIGVSLFLWIIRKKREAKVDILWDVIISVLISFGVSLGWPDMTFILLLLTSTVVSLVICLVVALLLKSKRIINVIGRITGRTINHDFWDDVIDPVETMICASYDSKRYYGYIHQRDERDDTVWVSLHDYKIYENDKLLIDSSTLPYPSEIVIQFNEADHVELYYQKGSKYPYK